MSINQSALSTSTWRNHMQSLAILAVMGGFVWLLTGWLLGPELAWVALVGCVLFMLLNPALSTTWLMQAYQATRITPQHAPELLYAVERLSERAGLSHVPALYYVPVGTMNAFATGNRDDAAIGLSDGLLRQLRLDEIVGVLAHEISHIRHQDLRVMTLSDLMGQLTRFLSLFGQLLIFFSLPLILTGTLTISLLPLLVLMLAPGFSALLQLALSRRREFLADASAAELMGTARPLIKALQRLGQQNSYWERFYRASSDNALLRTHPTTEERVRQLAALETASRWEPITLQALHARHWLPVRHIPTRRVSRYFWF